MLLLSENIQDGLHPIEEGQHQIDSGLRQEAYAARIGVSRNTLKPKIEAARVYATIRKTVPLSEEAGAGAPLRRCARRSRGCGPSGRRS